MDVVTEQPTTDAKKDPPPNYSQQQQPPPSTGLPPAYNTVYNQSPGPPQGAGQVVSWMPPPLYIPTNCPPGLEYLTMVEEMIVNQQVELIEALTDIECANRYKITAPNGQQVYFATEESELCERICCKNARGFIMHIWDHFGREVMRINRPFQFCAGCCWCADNEMCSLYVEVEAPVGQVIGRVRQTKSCWVAHYDILTPDDIVIFKIRGPTCVCDGPCCVADQDFVIYGEDLNLQIGKISKQWSGFAREMFTQADKFSVSFPLDLDVKMKATLFGALFLIDFMFFEYSN